MKRGLVWSTAGVGINTIGALIVTPALVRALGVAGFGVYVLIMAISSYAGVLDLGLGWAAGRFFSRDFALGNGEALGERFASVALLFMLVGVVAVTGSFTVGPAILRQAGAAVGSPGLALAIAGLGFAFSLQASLFGSLLRAADRFAAAQAPPVLGSLSVLTGSYVVAKSGGGLMSLIVLNAAVNAAVLVAVSVLSSPILQGIGARLRWSVARLREMAGFGGWSTANRVVTMLMLQVDRLAVSLVGSVTGLTYYAVPANVASRVNVVGGTAASLFFARASQLAARGDWQELSDQHARATRLLASVAVAAAVPLCALGPRFLGVWIGPEMERLGGPVLIPLVCGYAVISVSSLDAATLEGCGRPDLTAKAMLGWAFPVIIAALTGTKLFGFRAIAYGVAAWLIGVGVTTALLCRRRLRAQGAAGGKRSFWLRLGILAVFGWIGGTALVPPASSLGLGLAALGLTGASVLLAAYFLLLERSEQSWLRAAVMGSVRR
ncbi:MAG: lipopolysaccharide biosynthesis protein [Thermoanaerobaculia bacterium]